MDAATPKHPVRLVHANRQQTFLRPINLEELLPADDQARQVWGYVSQMDLTEFHAEVRSVEGVAGRPAIDPAILLSVWLLAIAEGVGSSRKVAELCEKHQSYQWLCGGVPVEYRTLSNFRVRHASKLDNLLAQGLAVLQHAGLLEVESIAQDGMRVRASAGTSSYRREKKLKQYHEDALARVKQLREEMDADPGAYSRRQAAARLRAAEDRAARLTRSLAAMRELEAHQAETAVRNGKAAKKDKGDDSDGDADGSPPVEKAKKENRISTTDPEARVMKFANGGYHPGYNVQFATDVATGVIVGVGQTNRGSDANQIAPMLEQVTQKLGHCPKVVLADAGYCAKQDIEATAAAGAKLYTPGPQHKPAKRKRWRRDSPAVGEWRSRMETEEAKKIYAQRAPAAECTNADARQRGLYKVTVRGLSKVGCVVLLFAICHNMMRTWSLMRAMPAAAA